MPKGSRVLHASAVAASPAAASASPWLSSAFWRRRSSLRAWSRRIERQYVRLAFMAVFGRLGAAPPAASALTWAAIHRRPVQEQPENDAGSARDHRSIRDQLVFSILQRLWSGPSERDVSWWPIRCGAGAVANRIAVRSSQKKAPAGRESDGHPSLLFGPATSAQVPAQGTRSIPEPHAANYGCEASPSRTRKIGATFGRMLGHVHFAIRDGATSAPRAGSVALQTPDRARRSMRSLPRGPSR
jgi:hypothetical protein